MVRHLFLGILCGWVIACSSSSHQPGRQPASDALPAWTTAPASPDSAFVNAYALLIGISQYAPGSGWDSLQTRNDLRLMQKTLLDRGFQRDHILTVTDQQATRAGLVQALQRLTDSVRRGSKVVILYAGHGQQLTDDDNDEPDGFDEAIVPYDAPKLTSGPGYHGERHLRDDEINRWIRQLRQKAGPTGHVLLLFDSCYAGTMTRANGQTTASRGGAAPIGARQRSRRRPTTDLVGWSEPENRLMPGLASYVLLAATIGDAPNFEYTDPSGAVFGPLTLAVCQAWDRLGGQVSYRAFFEEVRQVMTRVAPYQKPGLAGDADAGFLGWIRVDNPSSSTPGRRTLTKNSRYETIRQFARNNPDVQVGMRLIRVRVAQKMGHLIVEDTLPVLGQPETPAFTTDENERMILQLDNRSTKPCYVAVLDLLPAGTVKLLLPEPDRAAAEYLLMPGQRITRRIRVTKPFGLETYKLLLTTEPVDWQSVLAIPEPALLPTLSRSLRTGATQEAGFRVVDKKR